MASSGINLPAPLSLAEPQSLKQALATSGWLPSQEDEIRGKKALALLDIIIAGDGEHQSNAEPPGRAKLVQAPVGSFALGTWTKSSDIDCLYLGNISSRIFFSLTVQRIRRSRSNNVRILNYVNSQSSRVLEVDADGAKVKIQYSAATVLVDRWPEGISLAADHPAFDLSVQALSTIKPLRDLVYLRQSLKNTEEFRLAYRAIKTWAVSRGLYAPRYGLMGGIHLTVLLVSVCSTLLSKTPATFAADMVTAFFRHYARFDWNKDVVFDSSCHQHPKYHRSLHEPMCLLGWHGPALNTAMTLSSSVAQLLTLEFARAESLLSAQDCQWKDILGSEKSHTSTGLDVVAKDEFLRGFKSYVRVDSQYWGRSPRKRAEYVRWLETKLLIVQQDIDNVVPDVTARLWPARLVEPSQPGDDHGADQGDADSDFQYCHLIGLQWKATNTGSDHQEQVAAAHESLLRILQRFEEDVRSDATFFDSHGCWMSASIVGSSGAHGLDLDQRHLGRFECAEFEAEEDLILDDDDDGVAETEVKARKAGHQPNVKSRAHSTSQTDRDPSTARFRTALDVINRLRWDERLDASDYVVGYEDRFIGAQEKPVEQWKTEQTDVEFIPQHRVLYFKRKIDGAIIWDRRARVDKVFGGSGLR